MSGKSEAHVLYFHVAYRSIIALCSLVYLIPDARSRPNHDKVIVIIEVSIDKSLWLLRLIVVRCPACVNFEVA